jgi:hypothetical protein
VATSNSFDFSLTAAQLIARAAKNLGVLDAGGTIDTDDETDLLQTLNVIAKELQGTSDGSPGMKVHTRQRVTLFLAKGQQTYTIGPASSDARAATLYGRTTLSAAEANGQTALSITSNTDTTTFPGTTVTMTDGDIIGIELDDGTIYWSTISGTPGATATVAVAITGDAAAGNYVYWFTSRAQRFPAIESAVVRDENRNDRPIDVYVDAREYDQGVADKYSDGTPTAILVEPLRISTRVTLNSQPTNVTEQIVLTVLYPSEDYDATTNDIAFPQEWLGYLEWELTLRGCPMYGKSWTPEMQLNYANAKSRATSLNPENSTLYFMSGPSG